MPILNTSLFNDAEITIVSGATGIFAERLKWDMASGGIPFEDDFNSAALQTGVRPPRGIFAEVPGATPKYATNDGTVDGDFRESMARMFLQLPNYEKVQKLKDEFATKPETLQIAKVLAGTVSEEGESNGGKGYIDFLLQSVQHGFQEKSQIIEVLADEHVAYFFGQGAPVFTYAGTLINTKQDDQAMNMLRLYNEMGRGTKLAQRNTLLSIRYDGLIVSGAMLNLSMNLNAEMETAVPFNFTLLVKQTIILPNEHVGIVQLSKPFAISKYGYLPFSTGLSDLGTASVKIVGVPPIASAPVPAATPKQTEPQPDAREKFVKTKAQTMAENATVQKASTVAQQAPEVNPYGIRF